MSVVSVALKNLGDCSSVSKYTIEGEDLVKLKKLVVSVMEGDANDPHDGLQEIYQDLKQVSKDQSPPAMALQTTAVSKWIDQNRSLNKKLKEFGLQPRVSDCRSTEGFCNLTQNGASPDLYSNMVTLVGVFNVLNDSEMTSLTYYIYGQPREKCPFFGMHEGILTLNLEAKCKN